MNNAKRFNDVFGIYATELWAMPEKEFLEWLNAKADLSAIRDESLRINKAYDDGCKTGYEQARFDYEQKWIPVTERLPEEDDYRPCYGHDDGVVWWANDMGIIGLGWYYNSTGQWAYYDEFTHSEQSVGKVLAWMPLPEPYKGET